MYSGTTFHTKSGRVIGAHQKIDRIARRYVSRYVDATCFPRINDILHFEGLNGPDGLKRKSPSKDEPWHHIDPYDPSDHALIDDMLDHRHNLIAALREGNHTRAAFEAAWLAHTITDGLTPAHHFPLSKTIESLWGKPKEERLTVFDKNIIRGANKSDTIRKNWQYWGAKGVWPTHFLYEWGVATTFSTLRYEDYLPDEAWCQEGREAGLEIVFRETLQEIASLDMYHTYWQKGWSRQLARQTRTYLAPAIITMVLFAWYDAIMEVGA